MADLVATWEVPLYDRTHKISFEHGTTTGRRVVKVDDEVITRRDWMFKLVGSEQFQVWGLHILIDDPIRNNFSLDKGAKWRGLCQVRDRHQRLQWLHLRVHSLC